MGSSSALLYLALLQFQYPMLMYLILSDFIFFLHLPALFLLIALPWCRIFPLSDWCVSSPRFLGLSSFHWAQCADGTVVFLSHRCLYACLCLVVVSHCWTQIRSWAHAPKHGHKVADAEKYNSSCSHRCPHNGSQRNITYLFKHNVGQNLCQKHLLAWQDIMQIV